MSAPARRPASAGSQDEAAGRLALIVYFAVLFLLLLTFIVIGWLVVARPVEDPDQYAGPGHAPSLAAPIALQL